LPLVDFEIEKECIDNALVVPYNKRLLNPASIDVRIGNTARIETIDYIKDEPVWVDVDLSAYSETNPYLLPPKAFILVGTLETFNLPSTITAEFRLKSSRAREGWNNCLAVYCDNGWHGSVLTMELINECRYHCLPLYPGLKIGQMVFHRCNEPQRHYGITGRYNGDKTVMGSRG
jgi:dCTP deaminase